MTPSRTHRRTVADPAQPRSFLKHAALVFAAALLVRLVHLWQMQPSPYFEVLLGDSKAYDQWAQRLAAGDWIGTDVFYQAPLYPYFLGVIYAVFGRDLLVVRVVQSLLGSAACVLLALTGRRLFSDRAGLAAGLMLALYAPAVFFDGLLQKASLDVLLVCWMLWLISGLVTERQYGRRWLWLGIVMGLLSLSRENALALVAVAGGWALLRGGLSWPAIGPRLRSTVLLVAGLAIVLLPVVIRNNFVSGGLYLTTSQFGANFYLGNNPYTDGTASSMRGGRGSAEFERTDAVELAQAAVGRTLSPSEVSTYWTRRTLDFITAQPGAWVKLMGRKFALLWNRTEMLDTESLESYAEWSWPLRLGGLVGHFGVVVPLAFAGIIVTWPLRSRLWVVYALGAAYAASVMLFFIYARYRYPLVPWLLLFAGAGAAGLPAWVREHSRSGVAVLSVVVAAVVVATNWPALSASDMRAITAHNLGAELQTLGRIADAMAQYRAALAANDRYAPAYNNLGTALSAQGQSAEAIRHYERALAIEPAYANAHYNLGNALLNDGRPAEAIRHFRRSLELGPGSTDVHNNLAVALADLGRLDEAIEELRAALKYDAGSIKTRRNLASLLLNRRAPAAAVSELEEVTKLAPGEAAAHNDLGVALLAAGRSAEAAAAFERALQLAPGFVEAQRNLAEAKGVK